MTNKEQYFLEAINAGEPNADLIYADWLEEQGRPEADEIRDPIIVALRNWSRSTCKSAIRYNRISFRMRWIIFGRWYRSCSGNVPRPRIYSKSGSRFNSGAYSRSRRRFD